MTFFLTVCLLLFYLSVCFVTGQRNVTKTLTVSNGATWGDWHTPEYCGDGTYAVGYDMKIEPPRGGRDDTALNGIKLRCASLLDALADGGEANSAQSKWGSWVGLTKCDNFNIDGALSQFFLTAFSLQVEGRQGGGDDDTAANYIKFKCRDYANRFWNQYTEVVRPPGRGRWGTYGEWSDSCDADSAICGISTRLEAPLRKGKDDTALNDVKLYCCGLATHLGIVLGPSQPQDVTNLGIVLGPSQPQDVQI